MKENNFWKNRIGDTVELSNELNVDEEKIKELKEEKREIEGETLDRVLEITNKKTPLERKIENSNIYNWYLNTNLAELRLKFGYRRQKDLGNEIGIGQGTICQIEQKKLKTVSGSLKKMYYFFNNDFNKQIENDKIKKTIEKKQVENKSEVSDETLIKEIERLKLQIKRYEKLIDLI
jgi:transcriptional regulator with XRE-family HTH domain|nr:MAG TPA_asm: Regulatory protein [Caudoviricetes sp.]